MNDISAFDRQLALYTRAMAHPVRIYILKLLSGQTCCYSGDLAEVLPIARSTLSRHLKVLKDSGLIQGEINPPKIKYCLNKENWEEAKRLCYIFFASEQKGDEKNTCEQI
jgi:ArsR family transcriptional regulator, arsenate/arsenite/antimonite-responsive transcriptional repressor